MITVNLDKAKDIAHDLRRSAREAEFAPHDAVIMKQIPGVALETAEASRQLIREKYALMQTQMDDATTVAELQSLLPLKE